VTARLVVAVASPVKREGSTRAKHNWVQWQEKVMASEVSRVSNLVIQITRDVHSKVAGLKSSQECKSVISGLRFIARHRHVAQLR